VDQQHAEKAFQLYGWVAVPCKCYDLCLERDLHVRVMNCSLLLCLRLAAACQLQSSHQRNRSQCQCRGSSMPEAAQEVGALASWSATSAKAGNGVDLLRDGRPDTYWQYVAAAMLGFGRTQL
jgi:hypothetical protein